MDNYATHKTPLIWAWFAKRPRFHVHFTPTYASWLNLIERWFAELTTKQLRRGVHRNVRALEAVIEEFIAAHNAGGAPFVWTKTADEILASIARFARRTLNLTQAPEQGSPPLHAFSEVGTSTCIPPLRAQALRRRWVPLEKSIWSPRYSSKSTARSRSRRIRAVRRLMRQSTEHPTRICRELLSPPEPHQQQTLRRTRHTAGMYHRGSATSPLA